MPNINTKNNSSQQRLIQQNILRNRFSNKVDYTTSSIAFKEKLEKIRSIYAVHNQNGLTNSDIPVPYTVSVPPMKNYISPKLFLYLNKKENRVSKSYDFNRKFAKRSEIEEKKNKKED